MSPEEFQEVTGVSRETCAQFEAYEGLLKKWSKSINLIGPSTASDIWRRHFFDSAQLFPLLPEHESKGPRVIADLGSGAGFPGLVLSIMGAGDIHLLEADQKKAVFLREVVRQLSLNVTVRAERIEKISDLKVDLVTARACAPLNKLLSYARPLMKPDAHCLFLKGRNVDQELAEFDTDPFVVERFISSTDPEAVILRMGGFA